MKFVSIILLICIITWQSWGQSKRLLSANDFRSQKIDQEWIYVKHKPGSKRMENLQAKPLNLSTKSNAFSQIVKVKVPKGMNAIQFCNELRKSNDIVYADPIVKYQLLSTPSDPLIANQYYLDIIRAYEAWDITQGDDDITIAIIDSGMDLDHEDIINNLWVNVNDPIDGVDNDQNGYSDDYYGYDFADVDSLPEIQNGSHGMIVGGIASASTNNGKGIGGVGYNTKVAALKGFRTSNGTSNGLYEAIIYAAENGMDVLNLSWGRTGTPLQSEQDIIRSAVFDYDVVVVAAAGNEGGKSTEELKFYPASYDHVLSVGGSDANDNKSSGSSFNYSVDLLAPGVAMYSTVPNNGYADGGPGTSFAAPQVAATAALVKDQYPNLTAVQIMERVRATADDIYDIGNNSLYEGKLGKGRLNVLRAVSESNVKSLRAENPTLSSQYGEVFFGDTVKVTATLTNYLAAVNDPIITISATANEFTPSQDNFMPGFMATMDTSIISFEVILDDNLAPETQVGIRLDYSAIGYNDFQYMEVSTSPDYTDFGNDQLSLTISGNGNLGYNRYGTNPEGSGFQYGLDTIMTYSGLMLATDASNVSDNIVSDYADQSRSQDFSVQKNYKLYHHPGADYFGYSEFTDPNHTLIIEQSNITWSNEDFLIIRYRLVNNSSSAINNLSVGIYADWDLSDATQNMASHDAINNYLYIRNSTSDLYAAIKVAGGDSFEYSALDLAAYNGNSADIINIFSDSIKFEFLVNQSITSAGGQGAGNDVAILSGITINQLNAYAEAFVNVIYAVANTKANLDATIQSADSLMNDFLQHPRVLETFYTCDGTAVSLDPTAGTTYEFYEDPLAQILITTASSFNPGTITKDTSFYVKNVDNPYPSDVFEVRLNLLNDIADFSMSTDTLYLDDPITNVIQFYDQSLDAISWQWDFGEGTTSTIQNPLVSFTQIGNYSITLQVENALGCIDTETKMLVVAQRPDPPTFTNRTICQGDDVVLTDPTAEKIHLYAFENQEIPSLSGSELTVAQVNFDTTIYVSGVYGGYESTKLPLNINVMKVDGAIFSRPDTLSEAHQMVFEAINISNGASLLWTINGTAAGTDSQVVTSAQTDHIEVTLSITNTNNCVKTITQTHHISTSAFASQPDLIACDGEPVLLTPENGTYFGFYADAALTQLIKKGTRLFTNQYDKIYVVGLDDGLPGMPIEVNITSREVTVSIDYSTQTIGNIHLLNLAATTANNLLEYFWYLNGELTEISSNPTFFLTDGIYQVRLDFMDDTGCTGSDSITVDLTKPLSVAQVDDPLYPNPSTGFVNIRTKHVQSIQVLDIGGRLMSNPSIRKGTIDLSELTPGMYILRLKTNEGIKNHPLLIK